MQAQKELSENAVPGKQKQAWLIALMTIIAGTLLCSYLWYSMAGRSNSSSKSPPGRHEDSGAKLDTIQFNSSSAGTIKVTRVGELKPAAKEVSTGIVEPDQQKIQQISSLAPGRVDSVLVALGDQVRRGQVLLRIKSPQVAELHGKLHEAETKLFLSRATLSRARQAANRVLVLKAKATLDEAESTLKRTRQLVSEGLTARKDLVAASSEFERAMADYNFQKEISLNKEVSEAEAAVQTNQTDMEHIRDSLRTLDAQLPNGQEEAEHDISSLELRAPISGIVIERSVNPGAGVQSGNPLLTLADTSTLWVIANVPERAMESIRLGMTAEIMMEGRRIQGLVSFIDPILNEDTRTSRVRIVISNPDRHIQVGAFVQVEFKRDPAPDDVLFVPDAAVQTLSGQPVVFIKEDRPNLYRVRQVSTGNETEGLIPIYEGLKKGDVIAVQGSFLLKSKLLKGQMED